MRTANIQCQFTVDEDPHIVVAGEEEANGDFLSIIADNDLAVVRQGELELQLCTEAVVVLVRAARRVLVEGEEAMATVAVALFIAIIGAFVVGVSIR